MGVVVPIIDSEIQERTILNVATDSWIPPKVDEAAKKFEKSIQLIIELGETEKQSCYGNEIESTKRRVNALEHIIIPRLQNTVKYIEMRLEEMERESFVRLKMVKSPWKVRRLPMVRIITRLDQG